MTAAPVTLRSLGRTVYLPSFLFFLADGAILALLALSARDLGASAALAGFVVALRGLGVLFFDLPAGWIVARFGERVAVAIASSATVVALTGWALTDSVAVFGALAFLHGAGFSVWQLARVTYVSEVVPIGLRGRALSTLGGTVRFGLFTGPLIAAGLTAAVGLDGVYVAATGLIAAAATVLLRYAPRGEGRARGGAPVSFGAVLRAHGRTLVSVGSTATALMGLRAARIALVPLWADHIGLSTATASLLFGLSIGVELLLVYPGGSIMDRFGRKAVAVPSLLGMSAALLLLPLTGDALSLGLVAALLGVGNGLSSGVVMTLGADLAPADGRAQFLGAWRVFGDAGVAGGPLLVAAVTALLGLGDAAVACGLVGLLSALYVARVVPETLRRPTLQEA